MIIKIIKNLRFSKIWRSYIKKDSDVNIFRDDVEQIFNIIYKRNYWKGKKSISGTGSDETQTKIVRQELNKLLQGKDISSILDLPCGDFYWMRKVNLKRLNYIGGDIVEEIVKSNNRKFANSGIKFLKINLIKDDLPSVDLIFCRDCLVHFSFEDIFSALENISLSGSKYLLTTTFSERDKNDDILTGHWRPLNLQKPPFNFPVPLTIFNEGCTEVGNFTDKSMGLWKIDDLKKLK